jgi:hypothetical protein
VRLVYDPIELTGVTTVKSLPYHLSFKIGLVRGPSSRKWYMTQLHKVVGDLSRLAICSDACKGLLNAVRDVFPQA